MPADLDTRKQPREARRAGTAGHMTARRPAWPPKPSAAAHCAVCGRSASVRLAASGSAAASASAGRRRRSPRGTTPPFLLVACAYSASKIASPCAARWRQSSRRFTREGHGSVAWVCRSRHAIPAQLISLYPHPEPLPKHHHCAQTPCCCYAEIPDSDLSISLSAPHPPSIARRRSYTVRARQRGRGRLGTIRPT